MKRTVLCVPPRERWNEVTIWLRRSCVVTNIVITIIGIMILSSVFLPVHAQNSVARIDITKTGEPISKYIYGQFIEHLGRCIYGGLWAEMLEDRKFFYPVTGETPAWSMFAPDLASWDGEGHPYELLTRSPWMIIGDKQNISMETDNSFVGEHTPRISLTGDGTPSGILQNRLALVEGKGYMGRIVLAGTPDAGPVRISLVWGGGASDRETITIEKLTTTHSIFPLQFCSKSSTDNGRIEIIATGKGHFSIGTASIMPDDNILGWRNDTVALLKELNSPVYRWPGGNFVSGYD